MCRQILQHYSIMNGYLNLISRLLCKWELVQGGAFLRLYRQHTKGLWRYWITYIEWIHYVIPNISSLHYLSWNRYFTGRQGVRPDKGLIYFRLNEHSADCTSPQFQLQSPLHARVAAHFLSGYNWQEINVVVIGLLGTPLDLFKHNKQPPNSTLRKPKKLLHCWNISLTIRNMSV